MILDEALVDFDSSVSPWDNPELWVCEETLRMKAISQAIAEQTKDFQLVALPESFTVHSVSESTDAFVA